MTFARRLAPVAIVPAYVAGRACCPGIHKVESRFEVIWDTLLGRLNIWRTDLAQRLHEEVCLKADYCNNRQSQDFAFWSDLIVVIAGILGDLDVLALSLVLVRRLLDQLCACPA